MRRESDAGPGAGPGGRPPGTDDARVNAMLVRAGNGDERAFEEVYDALAAPVMSLVCRVLRDRAQAEEVTQEVMVELWRTADRFDPQRGAARGWLLTLAHRRAVDRVRAAVAARAREERSAAQQQELPFDVVGEAVEVHEEHRLVARCVAGLAEQLRVPVVLAYYEGLTYAEVATSLAAPAGTIKSRLRQGLRHLRECLEARR